MSLVTILIVLFLLAFVCEYIDSALGMGYGTILSPTLIVLGFPILTVVPAILISQACGGLLASYFHHRFENAYFSFREPKQSMSNDMRAVLWITSLGILASIIASFVGVKLLSKAALSTYIGTLVLIMGYFILIDLTFSYSVRKMVIVGLVSAFNKGLSGGGFGPLVTGGQVVLGSDHRKAIGVTTFAEGPICIAGFLTYWALNGIERLDVVVALTLGALAASPLGAYTTKKLEGKLKFIIGTLLILLGELVLFKTYGLINIPLSL